MQAQRSRCLLWASLHLLFPLLKSSSPDIMPAPSFIQLYAADTCPSDSFPHPHTFFPNSSPAFLHRTYYLALSLCPLLDCRLQQDRFCLPCSLLSSWPLHSAWLTHNGRMGRGGGWLTHCRVLTRLSTVSVGCFHFFRVRLLVSLGLPWWLCGKESACQCRRPRFNPWSWKISWSRKWQPTPVFLPGKFRRERS